MRRRLRSSSEEFVCKQTGQTANTRHLAKKEIRKQTNSTHTTMFLFQLRGNGKRLQGEPEICLAFFGTPALSLNTLKLQNGEWLLLIFNAYFINPCHNFVGQVELPFLSHQSTQPICASSLSPRRCVYATLASPLQFYGLWPRPQAGNYLSDIYMQWHWKSHQSYC